MKKKKEGFPKDILEAIEKRNRLKGLSRRTKTQDRIEHNKKIDSAEVTSIINKQKQEKMVQNVLETKSTRIINENRALGKKWAAQTGDPK